MLQRASESRVPATKTDTFPAPVKGWVQSGNVVGAGRDQAEVLDNFFPTGQGARLRGGISELADLGAAAVRLFVYQSGTNETLFGATDADIFDTSDIAGGAVKTSLTSGDWSTTQISTAGGEFLVGVNGADTGFTYNGSTFSDLALTGVDEDAVSQVWLFKERLFFVEGGTPSVWYLAVESIGGTATEINLGSVFRRGGNVLFGATWSLDSGNGLDDVCLFVSTTGEVAVYEGTDPSSAATWALVGVYDIGEPLNKHAFFKAGGDLAILTEDGIIPISEALRKDRAALQANAITYPIEDAWKTAIANRATAYPISATLWQSQTLLVVGTPQEISNIPVSFVANARTGAWCRVTGWDIQCSAVFEDKLYFGDENGKVYRADVGGTDDGVQYTGIYVPKFITYPQNRNANFAGLTYRGTDEIGFEMEGHSDYSVGEILPPDVATSGLTDVWGAGVWGTFTCGRSSSLDTFTEWQTVSASGLSLAPSIAVTSNQTGQLVFEILATRLRSEAGYEF